MIVKKSYSEYAGRALKVFPQSVVEIDAWTLALNS